MAPALANLVGEIFALFADIFTTTVDVLATSASEITASLDDVGNNALALVNGLLAYWVEKVDSVWQLTSAGQGLIGNLQVVVDQLNFLILHMFGG